MSGRLLRVNSLLQQEVGLIINRDLQNAKMQFVTVLRADISCDLRSGRIFVSVLCKDKKEIDDKLLNLTLLALEKYQKDNFLIPENNQIEIQYDSLKDNPLEKMNSS